MDIIDFSILDALLDDYESIIQIKEYLNNDAITSSDIFKRIKNMYLAKYISEMNNEKDWLDMDLVIMNEKSLEKYWFGITMKGVHLLNRAFRSDDPIMVNEMSGIHIKYKDLILEIEAIKMKNLLVEENKYLKNNILERYIILPETRILMRKVETNTKYYLANKIGYRITYKLEKK